MDEARAREVLEALGREAPGQVLLWRGESLSGSDIDILALAGHGHRVARTLARLSLSPAPQQPGRVLWRQLPGEPVVVDVLAPHAWPPMYPPLAGVVDRAARTNQGLLVASSGDRLLIHAAEAIAGWPLRKTADKLFRTLNELDAQPSLAAASGSEPGLQELARIALDTAAPGMADGLERLPLRRSWRASMRSAQARAAVRERIASGLGLVVLPALPEARRATAPIVSLSGMDGAGKSTAALALVEALERSGHPSVIHWTRLAGDLRWLDRLARTARRALGRGQPVASLSEPARQADRQSPQSRPMSLDRLVDGLWVLLVALATVRTARRALAIRRRGIAVVCDRWAADSVVDLRLRYGRHRLAECVLRRAFPSPDLAVLLYVDDATAAARKPGDQPDAVLQAMAAHYDELADRLGLVRVDAHADRESVVRELRELLPASAPPRRRWWS